MIKPNPLPFIGAALAVIALCCNPASFAVADEIDSFVPEDTGIYTSIHFKQLFSTPLFKKHALEPLRKLLTDNPEVKGVLEDLGFDPFADLDRMVSTGPGGKESEKGVVILHGKFNLEKFKAKAEEVAKSDSELLKINPVGDGKGGKFLLYEVNNLRLQATIYVALPNATTLLASPAKDYVVDAVRRTEKPKLKNADFESLIEKMNPRQTVSFVMLSSALKNKELNEGLGKQVLENLDAIGGGITIGEDIAVELAGNSKTAESARDLTEKINDSLTKGLGLLALFASQDRRLSPLVDVLKTVKAQSQEKGVVLKLTIPSELIEKALNEKDKP